MSDPHVTYVEWQEPDSKDERGNPVPGKFHQPGETGDYSNIAGFESLKVTRNVLPDGSNVPTIGDNPAAAFGPSTQIAAAGFQATPGPTSSTSLMSATETESEV